MFARILIAAALVFPAAAVAQSRSASQPVTVEIVASGEIDAPATSVTMNATYITHGDTQAAADKAAEAKLQELLAAVQAQGIPAAAVTDLPDDELMRLNVTATADSTTIEDTSGATEAASDEEAKQDESAEPQFVASGGRTIRATSLAQAEAVKAALEKIDVIASEPNAELEDPAAAYRQAKARALRTARADADAYAKELGLRVVRVSRISEAGNQLFLPGLQDKLQRAITQGPAAMKDMFKAKRGTVHIEAGIVVEFVLAP